MRPGITRPAPGIPGKGPGASPSPEGHSRFDLVTHMADGTSVFYARSLPWIRCDVFTGALAWYLRIAVSTPGGEQD
jgi:hypothetical protein